MSQLEVDVVRSCAPARAATRTSAITSRPTITGASGRPRSRRGLLGRRRRPAPHLPHAEPARTPERVRALDRERLELALAWLAVGLGHHGVDDGGGQVLPHARIAAREPELETALDEQLLVDQ